MRAQAQPVARSLAELQGDLAASEYHARPNRHGLQAPNRAHDLRTYFDTTGIRLTDRDAPGEPPGMSLRLVALGRDGRERAVPPGEVSSAGVRVEIRRPGVVEWYVNGSTGLEQGFTLDRRPEGEGRLSLALRIAGGTVRSGGTKTAWLRASSGRELRYDGLVVFDANGRHVPAELRVPRADELRIDVEDAQAAYPLTIDPLLTGQPNAVLESNQGQSSLGTSVASAGDVNGDGYGDVLVGAPDFDAGEANEGAAFVFLGGPAGIANGNPANASATLQANQAGAALGWSVAPAGDVNADGYDDVIVGAYKYDAGEADEGAAFVFLGGPAGIASGSPATASATLQANQAGAGLGRSVASAGDVDSDGYDDVIVGADGYAAGQSWEGAAFVFRGGPAGIVGGSPSTASATLQSDQAFAYLGFSVASAGDVDADGYDDVIVGAWSYDAGQIDEGAAFVFRGGPAGVPNGSASTASATLQSDQGNAILGWSVASAGDVNGDGYDDVVVGAPQYAEGQVFEGAALVFLGGPTGVASGNPGTAAAKLQGNQTDAGLGSSVAGPGDVSGDGFDDLLVGASGYDAGQDLTGAAFVFLGRPTGVASGGPATSAVTLSSGQQLSRFGSSVAGAGDTDGDGFADVLVGAPLSGFGTAFFYRGGFVKGDLSFDLRTDLLWREAPTSVHRAWLMDGTTRWSYYDIVPAVQSYERVVGIDDFDGDWINDLLVWWPSTGWAEIWKMNGIQRVGAPLPLVPLSELLPPPWKPAATADFDHDLRPDVLWRNTVTQKLEVWRMAGAAQLGVLIPTPDQAAHPNWEVVAALDWNGDRHTDLLWYNQTSGKIVLWFMDANLVRITGQFTNPPNAGHANWQVVASGDYGVGPNGVRGTKDIVWRNATSGNVVVWHMDQAGNRTAGVFTNPSAPSPNPLDWTIVGPR